MAGDREQPPGPQLSPHRVTRRALSTAPAPRDAQ
jgi:hypothetical protein